MAFSSSSSSLGLELISFRFTFCNLTHGESCLDHLNVAVPEATIEADALLGLDVPGEVGAGVGQGLGDAAGRAAVEGVRVQLSVDHPSSGHCALCLMIVDVTYAH